MLFRFLCGHVGRTNEGLRAKAQAFIRVAEVRSSYVEDVAKNCPDCTARSSR
jgi:hypothetical protein